MSLDIPAEDNGSVDVSMEYHSSDYLVLTKTARAYFLDGAYDRAEATLDEVIPSIDSQDQVSSF